MVQESLLYLILCCIKSLQNRLSRVCVINSVERHTFIRFVFQDMLLVDTVCL